MRVLQINSVCGIGSTGRICTDLADLIEENGHDCRIAYGRESVPEKYRRFSVRIGSDLDISLHALRSRLFDDTGFGSKRATQKFIQWMESYQPDVVHLHNIHGYYINIELLFQFLASSGVPVIWTLHDCWAFTGHCVHFDFVGCEKWKTGCSRCPQKGDYPASILIDNSKTNYYRKNELFTMVQDMMLVAPSKWLANLIGQSFLKKYPINVIHNGINLDLFMPTPSDFRQRYGINDKIMVLGVADGWDQRKGLDDIIKMATMLDNRYSIVLIGISETQMKILPPNVFGIRRTKSIKELADAYTAADVFINPTYEDNYPTVNMEAIACGTPVITYDTGGSPESIDAGCGYVVKKGDIAQLIEKVRSFEAGKKQSHHCVKLSASYDKKIRFQEYLSLYKLMLKSKG